MNDLDTVNACEPTRNSGTLFDCAESGPDHGTDQTIVFGKFQVDAFLLESVQARFNEVLPYLLAYCEYTWQEILGEDFWLDMGVPKHFPLMCLKHLAQQPGSHLIVSPFSDGDTTFFETN